MTVDDSIYMNEHATRTARGAFVWTVFNIFSYGALPNQGTYPAVV